MKHVPPPPPPDPPFARSGLPHPIFMMIGLIGWLALMIWFALIIFGGSPA